jgi:hypothetical protein
MNTMSFLTDPTVLVWLAVSHTLFMVIPGLIAASDDWLHQAGSFRFKSIIHRSQQVGYPHYLRH